MTQHDEHDAVPRRSRRDLLRLAGAAAVGGAAASLGATPALATTGNLQYGLDTNNAGTARTTLTSSSSTGTLLLVNSSSGSGANPAAVTGQSTGDGYGVYGIGNGVNGFAIAGFGGAAQLRLIPWTAGPSANTLHSLGAVAYDSETSAYWVCVEEGTPGVWRKLADATTAGALHAIPTARVYDSRRDMSPAMSGVITTGTSRVVPCKDRRDPATGAVLAANVVPAGATAVAYNLTVTGTVGARGFLSVEPGNMTESGGSTINWSAAGLDLANASLCRLDGARQLAVFCGGPGAATHFIIDIVGYYR
jgi:hypothetical protein